MRKVNRTNGNVNTQKLSILVDAPWIESSLRFLSVPKLSGNGITTDNSPVVSHIPYQIDRYCHNLFRSFVLGNPELIVSEY